MDLIVVVFYDSTNIASLLAGAIVKTKYPNTKLEDTAGLNEGAVGAAVAALAATYHRTYVCVNTVAAAPAAGEMTDAQVVTLETKLITSAVDPLSDDLARKILENSGAFPNFKNRALLAWEDVYPDTTRPRLVHLLGAFQIYLKDVEATATAGTVSTVTLAAAGWDVNVFAGKQVKIVAGTGIGQIREISSNTATVLTVTKDFNTAPDATSDFEILTYNQAEDAVRDFEVPLYLQTYLTDLSLGTVQNTYKALLDENSKNVTSEPIAFQDEVLLADIFAKSKAIYDFSIL